MSVDCNLFIEPRFEIPGETFFLVITSHSGRKRRNCKVKTFLSFSKFFRQNCMTFSIFVVHFQSRDPGISQKVNFFSAKHRDNEKFGKS